jgi:8-oxo-dGTP diphosphatase
MQSSKVIEATLAFIFNADFSKVLLIKKEKPIQHAGLLNGLGGKLEVGESHVECLVREIQEEAGLEIAEKDWLALGRMRWANWRVTIWTCSVDMPETKNFPEPNVCWYPVSPLPKNVIENLEWLVPLAIDVHRKVKNKEEVVPVVEITYK